MSLEGNPEGGPVHALLAVKLPEYQSGILLEHFGSFFCIFVFLDDSLPCSVHLRAFAGFIAWYFLLRLHLYHI